MRVFVAGASGAIGSRLIPQLVERGHEVVGSSRSPGKSDRLADLGAEPIVLDLLDPALLVVLLTARPSRVPEIRTTGASCGRTKTLSCANVIDVLDADARFSGRVIGST